ncbi:MAG: YlbF family regulator [Syntrophomonadaceae bacterium]|nr:YlbF family regulator [Syntrophomonadaceae bacterium]
MSTDKIIQIAMELGSAIALSEQARALQGAQTQVLDNPEAARLLQTYQEARSQMENKLRDGLQVVPAEEERLEGLRKQLAGHPLIQELMTAQEGFNNLTDSVFFVINQAVSGDCSADCSSCGGSCSH